MFAGVICNLKTHDSLCGYNPHIDRIEGPFLHHARCNPVQLWCKTFISTNAQESSFPTFLENREAFRPVFAPADERPGAVVRRLWTDQSPWDDIGAVVPTALEQTRQAACQHPVVLFVQDTTELVITHCPTKEGLGPIGDGNGHAGTGAAALGFTDGQQSVYTSTTPFNRYQ